MSKVYISHAIADKASAERVASLLPADEFQVWHMLAGGTSGKGFIEQIRQVLSHVDIVVVLLSQAALESRTMQAEIAQAQRLLKPIIPVIVEAIDRLPDSLFHLPFVDATKDWTWASEQLVYALQAATTVALTRLKEDVPASATIRQQAARPSQRWLLWLLVLGLGAIVLIIGAGLLFLTPSLPPYPTAGASPQGDLPPDSIIMGQILTTLNLITLILSIGVIGVILLGVMLVRQGMKHQLAPALESTRPAPTALTKAAPPPLLEDYQLFVSSSERDKTWASLLVNDLSSLGYLVWWYAKDAPGLAFGSEIRSAIYYTKVFIIIVSPDSMTSKHTEEELRWAEIYDRPIVPVLCRFVSVEQRLYGLAKGAAIDFTQAETYKPSLELLMQAIDHSLKSRLLLPPAANVEQNVPGEKVTQQSQIFLPTESSSHLDRFRASSQLDIAGSSDL